MSQYAPLISLSVVHFFTISLHLSHSLYTQSYSRLQNASIFSRKSFFYASSSSFLFSSFSLNPLLTSSILLPLHLHITLNLAPKNCFDIPPIFTYTVYTHSRSTVCFAPFLKTANKQSMSCHSSCHSSFCHSRLRVFIYTSYKLFSIPNSCSAHISRHFQIFLVLHNL